MIDIRWDWIVGHLDDVAHDDCAVKAARVRFGDLGPWVHYLVDHLAFGQDAHVARYPIHLGRHVGHQTIIALVGRNQGCLNRFKDDLTIETFFRCHLVDAGNQCFRHVPLNSPRTLYEQVLCGENRGRTIISPLQQQKWGLPTFAHKTRPRERHRNQVSRLTTRYVRHVSTADRRLQACPCPICEYLPPP